MRKINFIVCLTMLCQCLSAQDTSWNKIVVDENLIISMPGVIEKLDTIAQYGKDKVSLRIIRAETALTTLITMVTPKETNIKIDNQEDLRIALDEIAKGSCSSAVEKGYTCQSSDTLIDDIPGKKQKIFYPGFERPALTYYWFLINNKSYTLTIVNAMEDLSFKSSEQESNRFLESVHFDKTDLKEKEFNTKAESRGYRIGYWIGRFLFVAAIGLVIYYFVRKV